MSQKRPESTKYYYCSRCESKFTEQRYLKKHLDNQQTPCDMFCTNCAQKFTSHHRFKMHIKNDKCTPIVMTDETAPNLVQNIAVNNGTNIGNLIIHNQTIINGAESQDFKLNHIKAAGFSPHESEIRNILYKVHAPLNKLLLDYCIEPEPTNVKNPYEQLIINIIQLFYSNPTYPYNINIIDCDPKALFNRVYGGLDFVIDKLPKDIRNNRILQLLMIQLDIFTKENKISKCVFNFVQDQLIPHLRQAYITGIYNEKLQEVWQLNNKLVTDLNHKYGPFPTNGYNEIINFDKQLGEYMVYDEQIRTKDMYDNLLKIRNLRQQVSSLL